MIGLPFPSDILQAALCGKERPFDVGGRTGMGAPALGQLALGDTARLPAPSVHGRCPAQQRRADGRQRQRVGLQRHDAVADLLRQVRIAAGRDRLCRALRKRARHGVGLRVLAIGPAVPDLDAVEPVEVGIEPLRVAAALERVRHYGETAAGVHGVDRGAQLPRVDLLGDEQAQQVPLIRRELNAGDEQKIRRVPRLGQGAVMIAHGDALQAPRTRARNDLAKGHAPVRRVLGMNVQVKLDLHGQDSSLRGNHPRANRLFFR